jgi:hypothetical protein
MKENYEKNRYGERVLSILSVLNSICYGSGDVYYYRPQYSFFTKKAGFLPSLLNKNDSLSILDEEIKELALNGEIHYGSILQANSLLYGYSWTKRMYNHPAAMLVSGSDYYDRNPIELNLLAGEIYKYKDKIDESPRDIRKFVEVITDEYIREFNVSLPLSVTDNEYVYYTTIMVYRQHLPKHRINQRIYPVLTLPSTLKSTVILPCKYWTKKFRKWTLFN